MSLDIFWFLPTSGDTRYLGVSDSGARRPTPICGKSPSPADELGYDGLLIPTGSSCLDPWVTAASLAPITRRIKLLVALRTSLGNVTADASGGHARRGVGRPPVAQRRARRRCNRTRGRRRFLDHEQRYEYADEFLGVWRRLFTEESVDFDGRHVHVRGTKNFHKPV